MNLYLRRLWAALCGRTLGPVKLFQNIWVHAPDGVPQEFTVTTLTYHQDIHRASSISIEAQNAAALRMRNRV